jgi:hypothetical protein
MATKKVQPQKPGRPATGSGTSVQVRLQGDLLSRVDKFASSQGVKRPEAVRRLILCGLDMFALCNG